MFTCTCRKIPFCHRFSAIISALHECSLTGMSIIKQDPYFYRYSPCLMMHAYRERWDNSRRSSAVYWPGLGDMIQQYNWLGWSWFLALNIDNECNSVQFTMSNLRINSVLLNIILWCLTRSIFSHTSNC